MASSTVTSEPSTDGCLLFSLPPELINNIIHHLSPYDITSFSATCHYLREHALSDIIWHSLVQENIPGVQLTSPAPYANYYELFAAYDLVWFLPRYKIWFCDRDLTGKLVVIRYDPRRGCIEGYQLIAVNKATSQPWPAHSEVMIHGFEPRTRLHLDKPMIQLVIQPPGVDGQPRPGANRFADDIPMKLEQHFAGICSNFLLARPLDPEIANQNLATRFPYGKVWPPPAVPARDHVRCHFDGPERPGIPGFGSNDRPRRRSEVSDQTFRVLQWMEMAGSFYLFPAGGPTGSSFSDFLRDLRDPQRQERNVAGPHIAEEIISYSTLDPALYTPTPLKPWRGIWVGDYSSHGCEFLLIHQPDDLPATDDELGLQRVDTETDAEWEARKTDVYTYRGRLEAIKLTGDPNVPRGEHTFIVDDLGPGGYVGDATDPPFTGARVVKSRGHVAETGFIADRFIDSQLLLLSHDRLAQHWIGFQHISFFERVNIDKFLKP